MVNMPVGEDIACDSLLTDVPLSNISVDKNRNDLLFLKVAIFSNTFVVRELIFDLIGGRKMLRDGKISG